MLEETPTPLTRAEETAKDMYHNLQQTPEENWKEVMKKFNKLVYDNLDKQMKELDSQRATLLTTIQSIKQG